MLPQDFVRRILDLSEDSTISCLCTTVPILPSFLDNFVDCKAVFRLWVCHSLPGQPRDYRGLQDFPE